MKHSFPSKGLIFFLCSLLSYTCCHTEEIFDNYPPHIERSYEYKSITGRYIDRNNVMQGQRPIPLFSTNLLDRIWHREEPGFLGYLKIWQKQRVYQDIIRFIIEEKLKISIGEDFHFFRPPGDPNYESETYKEYVESALPGDYRAYDTNTNSVLTLTFSFYTYHPGVYLHSPHYNKGPKLGELEYYVSDELVFLFNKIGIDTSLISSTIEIGDKYFGFQDDMIIQVFDMSHYNPWKNYYALADMQCSGHVIDNDRWTNADQNRYLNNGTKILEGDRVPISKMIVAPNLFISSLPSSFRMLLSNRYTLNPFAGLVIKRYDKVDQKIIQQYETELREYIRKLDADQDKIEQYKDELLNIWGISNENND